MNLLDYILKDNPNAGHGAKRVPRGGVIIAVIIIALGAAGYYGAFAVKQKNANLPKGVNAQISDQISAQPEQEKQQEDQRKAEIRKKELAKDASLKMGITTMAEARAQQEKAAKQTPLQFERSNNLGQDTNNDISLGSSDANSSEDEPLWERYKKHGMQGAATSPANQIINPTFDPLKRNMLGNNASGKPIDQTKGGDEADESGNGTTGNGTPQSPFAQYVAYKSQQNATTPTTKTETTAPTQHFLPAGTIIPVVFITGVNTAERLTYTGGGTTTPSPVSSSSGSVGSSANSDQSNRGGSLSDDYVIVQVARPVVAQHRLQLTTRTRILCTIQGDALTENEDVSRIFLNAQRIIFADGTQISLNGANFYDASDKERGVIAHRIVPPLWKRLLPIAIAKFGAGVLSASAGTTTISSGTSSSSLTSLPQTGTVTSQTISGLGGAFEQGGADALQYVTDSYLTKVLDENQPYSRIRPGAVAFIMLQNPVDLSHASTGLGNAVMHIQPAAPLSPEQGPRVTTGNINSLLKQYASNGNADTNNKQTP